MTVKRLRFDVSRDVSAPCARVWELLTDTGRWHEWGPSVRRVECDERYIVSGTKGWVWTPFGLGLPFRVTDYRERECWTWRVAGLPATGHRVEKVSDRTCRVVFEVPLLAAPYALVCRVAARRIARLLETQETDSRCNS